MVHLLFSVNFWSFIPVFQFHKCSSFITIFRNVHCSHMQKNFFLSHFVFAYKTILWYVFCKKIFCGNLVSDQFHGFTCTNHLYRDYHNVYPSNVLFLKKKKKILLSFYLQKFYKSRFQFYPFRKFIYLYHFQSQICNSFT